MSDHKQDVRFVRSEPHPKDPSRLKGAEDYMRERDQLGAQLSEISNLVAALEIVSWQLAQVSKGEDISQLRDAVVGISRCLLREVELRD